jgi:hypothetical protein
LRLNRQFALVAYLSMILSDLPLPAQAPNETKSRRHRYARAGNRYPFLGIML